PRWHGREWPLGLTGIAVLIAVPAATLVVTGDAAAIAGIVLVLVITVLLRAAGRVKSASGEWVTPTARDIELLPAVGIGPQIHVRPGNILVPLRRPGAVAHLVAALQNAGDRDVVTMTVRLIGVDVSDDLSLRTEPTEDERRLLTAAALVAERSGHDIRL